MTNKEHLYLLDQIKRALGQNNRLPENYLGNGDHNYPITNPQMRIIAKSWVNTHKEISLKDFIELLNSLYQSSSHQEKAMASMLIGYLPKLRKEIKLSNYDRWLDYLSGWAQVDGLCQSNFTAGELLDNWDEWESFINKLSADKNINKRRASLVLLTGPMAHSADERLEKLSIKMIERLKSETPILITKAISWLLRSMVTFHKDQVKDYVESNINTLPKIAVRETLIKVKTGKKNA